MELLKKVIDQTHGVSLGDMSAEKQVEYLSVVAQQGAREALKAIGLNDAEAAADIRDIRDLLRALRVLKKAAWTTTFTAMGRIIGWAFVVAIAALFVNGKSAREIAGIMGP